MAITFDTLDPNNIVINIPKADLALIQTVPTEIRQLDLDAFRLELKDWEDSTDGMAWTRTHNHNTAVEVGGVILSRVIQILEPYTITFEDGQYAVNLVGANSNVGDRVNVNQVSVRSANSAGLQDLSTLLASAYQGQVVIDPINGQAGTSVPIGTFSSPVNNVDDALLIAIDNGIKDLVFTTNMTITQDLSAGYNVIGTTPFSVVTFSPIADVTNVSVRNLTVQGEMDGLNTIRGCNMLDVDKLSGFVEKCAFSGQIELSGATIIMECYSNVVGSGYPTIMGMAGSEIQLRDFHGSIGLVNVTDGNHSVGVYGGRVVLDATCTGGNIHVRGDAFEIVDNSNGATIIDERSTGGSGGGGLTPTEGDTLDRIDDNTKIILNLTY